MPQDIYGGQSRRHYIIDGEAFGDLDGFYREMEKLFSQGLAWPVGHNLDAFNDLLRGGFGMHGYGEPISIEWRAFAKSRRELGDAVLLTLVTIILDFDDSGHDCTLEIYE